MKNIAITRDSGKVTFETVSIDITENVFFANLDPQAAHKPSICNHEIGPAPALPSSECPVPPPPGNLLLPYTVTYKCEFHTDEEGTINVFAVLAAQNTTLPQATVNQPLPMAVQLVVGGKSPYNVTEQVFQILDSQGKVIQSGSGSIGPGLQLRVLPSSLGIWVIGTPTVVGTYNFTFTVNDAMGQNLQQVLYTLIVV